MSFKQALNDAIREGLGATPQAAPFRTETAAMGRPAVPLDRALQMAAELEDDELVCRSDFDRFSRVVREEPPEV